MKPHSTKVKILAVDDIPANLLAIEQVLKPLNVEVVKANSGQEAISLLLRDTCYALILMDVQMPEMDGFETAEYIRQDIEASLIPIIFVTAISKEDKYIFKGYRSGAVDYIFKPFDEEILKSKVKIFVELYHQQSKLSYALQEVERAEYTKHLLLDNVADGIIGLDKSGNIIFINNSACDLLELNANDIIGNGIRPFVAPNASDDEWNKSSFCHGIRKGGNFSADDLLISTYGGNSFRSELNMVAIKENNSVSGAVLLFRDVTDKLAAQEKLLHLAQYDQLTGLANRMLFWNFLSKTIANSRRHDEQFALLYIDLDEFKQINDTMGHLAGDLLLTKSAERLAAMVREGDMVARLGGDEFAIVVTRVSSPEVVGDLAHRIIEHLTKEFLLINQSVQISASIGIAMYPGHGEDVKTFTRNADTAMYDAKSKGKNNYQFFSNDMQKSAEAYITLTKEMEYAIVTHEFRFAVNTVSPTDSELEISLPTLVWDTPKYENYALPDLLKIASAARCQQILENKFFSELHSALDTEACSRAQPLLIEVYLSAHQLKQGHIRKVLFERLEEMRISSGNLIVLLNADLSAKNGVLLLEELEFLRKGGMKLGLYSTQIEDIDLDVLIKAKLDYLALLPEQESENAATHSSVLKAIANTLGLVIIELPK